MLEKQDGKYIIEIRNKLSIGDTLEVLFPGKIDTVQFKIEKLWDSETKEEIQTVNPGKLGQTVMMEIPVEVEDGIILRRKK